uniref:Uncharacterized protein n=1 Tax=Tetranychus urticae TaxID=32264 RepID=A0A158P4S9_TETUR
MPIVYLRAEDIITIAISYNSSSQHRIASYVKICYSEPITIIIAWSCNSHNYIIIAKCFMVFYDIFSEFNQQRVGIIFVGLCFITLTWQTFNHT